MYFSLCIWLFKNFEKLFYLTYIFHVCTIYIYIYGILPSQEGHMICCYQHSWQWGTLTCFLVSQHLRMKMPLIHLLLYAAISIGSLHGSDLSWVIDLNEDGNENYLRKHGTELADLATCKHMTSPNGRYVPPTQVSHLEIRIGRKGAAPPWADETYIYSIYVVCTVLPVCLRWPTWV